jgi:hypothetical protein
METLRVPSVWRAPLVPEEEEFAGRGTEWKPKLPALSSSWVDFELAIFS